MFPCSPSEIPILLLLVTYKIIFQPWGASPTLPRLILHPRFCCGSRTVLTCKISLNLCKPFAQFISDIITDRLRTGATSLWGRVGEVPPAHLVMLLAVEPSTPRLYNDNRFLNSWIKDIPFQLDSLLGIPRYVFPSSFQSVCDDKSSCLPQKAVHILVSNGVAGTSPVTSFLSDGNRLPIFTILWVFSLLIIFVPSLYLAPCILMTVIRVKFSSPLRP